MSNFFKNLGGGGGESKVGESKGGFASVVSGWGTPAEPTFQEEVCGMLPKLTYTQRLIGFGVCMGLGYILSLMGTLMLLGGGPKAIRNFAALYVIGNIVALSGTGFLVGPQSQCKKMFHKCRRYACIFYLTMLAAVFVAAVAGAHVIIVLLLLIVQALAAVWYTASYIPYGRKFIVNTCCMPCKDCFKDLEGQGG